MRLSGCYQIDMLNDFMQKRLDLFCQQGQYYWARNNCDVWDNHKQSLQSLKHNTSFSFFLSSFVFIRWGVSAVNSWDCYVKDFMVTHYSSVTKRRLESLSLFAYLVAAWMKINSITIEMCSDVLVDVYFSVFCCLGLYSLKHVFKRHIPHVGVLSIKDPTGTQLG